MAQCYHSVHTVGYNGKVSAERERQVCVWVLPKLPKTKKEPWPTHKYKIKLVYEETKEPVVVCSYKYENFQAQGISVVLYPKSRLSVSPESTQTISVALDLIDASWCSAAKLVH